MRELQLVAVSEDGNHLILAGHDEHMVALRIDERLHAAIRGDRARLGQLDIQLESQLRPRDIQARIRAGESVEAVAAVAGMPLEKVERFAGPVLAEREHIAGRARQATVRRLGGDAPPQTLESAAIASITADGGDTTQITWDAWRREDGRWQVSCSWIAGEDDARALFSFDPSGRSVVPEDDRARRLAGEPLVDHPAAEPDLDPATTSGTNTPLSPARLTVVETPVDDEPDDFTDATVTTSFPAPAGPPSPAVGKETGPDDEAADPAPRTTGPLPAVSRRSRREDRYGRQERRRREPELWTNPTVETPGPPRNDRLRLSDIVETIEGADDDPDPPTAIDVPPVADVRKPAAGSARSRRPTVPSWDEIMFGRRKGGD